MSDTLRVLSVGTLFPPYALGGYELLWHDAVHRLRERGHTVEVLCSDWTVEDNGQPEDPAIRRGLGLYVDDLLDVRREGRAAVEERERGNDLLLREALADVRPEAALLGPVGGLPLSVLTRLHEAGVPQLAFVADDWPRYSPGADPWQRRAGRRRRFGVRREARDGDARRFDFGDVDHWVCISERTAEMVIEAGADAGSVSVLRPGPDTERFRSREPRPWRGELLYSGRLHPEKGVEHAIRALAEAPDCRLVIAGAGDPRYAEKLAGIAAEIGVEGRVRMLGEQRERLPQLYADADAVIFPSVWQEPWGLVPLEAMAVGCPVVGTAVGGAAEYLRDGENALVVEPADPTAIAAAVRRLEGDPALRERLIVGGSRTADALRYDRFLDQLADSVASLARTTRAQTVESRAGKIRDGVGRTSSKMDEGHEAEGRESEERTTPPESESTAPVTDWLPEGFKPPEPHERGSPPTSEWSAIIPRPAVAPQAPAPVHPRQAARQTEAAQPRPPAAASAAQPDPSLIARLGEAGERSENALKRAQEAAERSEQAISQANEFEQILSLAEGGWRQSLLELRARHESVEERLAGAEKQAVAAEERARAAEAEVDRQRDQVARETEALNSALRALLGRVEQVEAEAPEVSALREQIDRMQVDFAEVARRAKMGDELALALSRYGRRPGAEGGGEISGLDKLNEATFEQLRGLGLSVTQAARMIAVRDAQRGFRSAADLDAIPGLPAEVVADLKRTIES